MPSTITIYLDPESFSHPFHWEGPDTFRFENSGSSRIIGGSNASGEMLHRQLEPDEQAMLIPQGHIQEERLSLIDPAELKRVLLKAYDLYAQYMFVEDKSIKGEGRDPSWVFYDVKQDVGGAVLICERAIKRGCQVYLGLW